MNTVNSDNKAEIREFIKFIQQLSVQEQAGILQIVQGVKLLNQNKKQRINRRSRSWPFELIFAETPSYLHAYLLAGSDNYQGFLFPKPTYWTHRQACQLFRVRLFLALGGSRLLRWNGQPFAQEVHILARFFLVHKFAMLSILFQNNQHNPVVSCLLFL